MPNIFFPRKPSNIFGDWKKWQTSIRTRWSLCHRDVTIFKQFRYMKNYARVEVRLFALFISWPGGDECSDLSLDQYISRVLSTEFTGDFVGLKASQSLVAEGKIYVPAGKRTAVILIGAIPLCYRGSDKSLALPTFRCCRTESIVSLEIHATLTETLGEYTPSYATVKTGWPSLNVVNFPPFFPSRAKDLSAPWYLIFNKMVYSVLTQLQYIIFMATCFDFY
jgi:hypothetical protein